MGTHIFGKVYATLLYNIIALPHQLIYVNAAVALAVSEVLLNVNVLVSKLDEVTYQHQLANWQLSVGMVGVQLKSQYFQLVATVHKLGLPVKSQYFQLVATAHKLGVQVKSQYIPDVATTARDAQVKYQHQFANWQLSVGISEHSALQFNALFKSVWLLSVPVIHHHSALLILHTQSSTYFLEAGLQL